MSKSSRYRRMERGKSLIASALIILLLNIIAFMVVGALYMLGIISIHNGNIVINKTENTTEELMETFKMPTENSVPIRAQAVVDYFITDDMTDYEKVKTIHDWIVNWTTYDYGEFYNRGSNKSAHTEHGVFVTGNAVCDGYAKAFSLLCSMVGIRSEVVVGEAGGLFEGGPHAWNTVEIDDKWYIVDVTWNDGWMEQAGSDDIIYDYFLVTDSILEYTHTWDRAQYNTCYSDLYVLAGYDGRTAKTMFGIKRIIKEQYEEGNWTATVVYTGAGMPDTFSIREDYSNCVIFINEIGEFTRLTIQFND